MAKETYCGKYAKDPDPDDDDPAEDPDDDPDGHLVGFSLLSVGALLPTVYGKVLPVIISYDDDDTMMIIWW